mmetsp:Transcript_41474/g.60838  ORF Transcript_41474/g.60838 Transcript_41474/m.60838 type:complete len:325 (-) Transcript_41474:209-1183(-)|eukprot:CAMPEP_0195528490 /NCGR_PEP_ID=MMETSP0794_2-20130614/30650_1 /TAXON_ID=515487 /ORGANISM="Stephanopyxis turris, Strain CCMP 815" /LENGTH=324 /DNA_ID=CAMNT_0040659635 /DNA_START=96 /DNA_END=1070 /DNA_ORIENTATION=-
MHQQHPLYPDSTVDDDDGLDDLQFMTSVDTSIQQDVQIPEERGPVVSYAQAIRQYELEKQNNNPNPSSEPGSGVGTNATAPNNNNFSESSYANNFGTGPIGGANSPPNDDDTTPMDKVLSYARNSMAAQLLKESSHPIPAVFHVLFKLLALLVYLFGGWFGGFVAVAVVCIILLSVDFWVVKNITGRLLVGLRWWNKLEADGTTRWIFESAEQKRTNSVDIRIFWSVVYITPVLWSVLLFFAVIKLELGWLLIVIIALTLSGSNVYGYWKCSSDQKAKFSQLVNQGTAMGAKAATAAAIEHNVLGKMANLSMRGNSGGAGNDVV